MKRWIGIVGGVAAVGLLGWLLSQKPAEVGSGGVAPVVGPVAVVAESAFPDKGGAAVPAPAMDAVAAAAVPPVSDAVQVLVDPASDYATRLAAMRTLGYAIAPQDVAALMDFLNAPLPEGSKLKPNAYNSVRNDALELLLRQRQLPEGIGELLVGVYNDPRHDAMWRNYCLQFMGPYYERVAAGSVEQGAGNSGGAMAPSTQGSEADVPSRPLQAIQETLWEAMGERENSNAGTALLALDKLSRTHAGFDPAQVEAAMVALATDESASLANRATALRLCGERGNSQALETVRQLAQEGGTTMIRCAAIATLGDLGTAEDLALLETYAASSDQRIRQIAQTTLARMDKEPVPAATQP